MRVLYLSPLVPDLSGSGGKKAVYNHLAAMLECLDSSVEVVAIDEEGTGETWPQKLMAIPARIFPRELPRFGSGWRGPVAAVAQLLTSSLPRSVAVVRSKAAVEHIRSMLESGQYDVVVVDLLKAYGLIDGLKVRQPIVYISHNVEARIHLDRWRSTPAWSPGHWTAGLEFLKVRRYESRLLRAAARVISISSGDLDEAPMREHSGKLFCWPELPAPQSRQWSYRQTKAMLFVGSAQYFPNRDAIEWLVNELMPSIGQLDSGIRLKVVGTRKEQVTVKGDAGNVDFCGFVSHEELMSLHLSTDLFVSPVVQGSGIKIKVLEASAFGMPIAATAESLRGIDYLHGVVRQIDRDPDAAARALVTLLNDPDALSRIHQGVAATLQRAIRERAQLGSLMLVGEMRGKTASGSAGGCEA